LAIAPIEHQFPFNVMISFPYLSMVVWCLCQN
jgi:hypothetical protein